jgi:glycerol-3-phosphate acyltransferase PlsY
MKLRHDEKLSERLHGGKPLSSAIGIARIVVWVVAVFFAGSWAFGLVTVPRQRIGSTILTVLLWWVSIAVVALSKIPVFHLLWVFPCALVIPAVLLLGSRRPL